MTRSLTSAWLSDEPAATALLPRAFASASLRARCVEAAVNRTFGDTPARMDPVVLAAIRAQNAALTPSSSREQHLAALAQGGAACVVTGQQVGLFLGPLYTVYKAASAVAVARALSAETGRSVVPVFWLQNEDHDVDEIARVAVPGARLPHWLKAETGPADPRCSIATLAWSNSVEGALASLEEAIAGQPFAAETIALMRGAYRPSVGPCASFRHVLAELFSADGLIIVDPSDPALARSAAPVHHRAVQRADAIASALQQRAAELSAADFKVMVHVREGAPLSFYHPDGPAGPRYRLAPHDGDWELVGAGTRVPRAVIERDAVDAPERFSTSALLRPILQDAWLPTAAVVGGPGELAYFGQLAPLYKAFDLPQPIAVLRARFEVVGPRSRRQLDALGLEPSQLATSRADLLAAVGGARSDAPDALEARLTSAITSILGAARPDIEQVGGNLPKHVDKTEQAMTDFAKRLCDRYRRALVAQDTVQAGRLDALLTWFRPDGAPQERIYGLPAMMARFGLTRFLEAVRGAIEPFDPSPRQLDLSTPEAS